MKLAWLTDIHLDHAGGDAIDRLVDEVHASGADRTVISGDISVAARLIEHLDLLAARLARPVDFVLGNHDIYGSSFAGVRRAVREALATRPALNWLGDGDVRLLTGATALAGADGWPDARLGDYESSDVRLPDLEEIEDLAACPPRMLRDKHAQLGDDEANALRASLRAALRLRERVVVVTHVPPFREACWHDGAPFGDDVLPFAGCRAAGDVLLDEAARHPDRAITVLCGHVHSPGTFQAAPNLVVRTGGSTVGSPGLAGILDV